MSRLQPISSFGYLTERKADPEQTNGVFQIIIKNSEGKEATWV